MPARPIKLSDPFITLGGPTTPPPEDLTCFCKGIHLVPEEDDAFATFCDPLGYRWVLTLDLLMSLGVDSLDEALSGLGGSGTVVAFEFAYDKGTASAANPHWRGEIRLPAYAIVDAGINEPSEITLEMDVIGEIEKSTDGTTWTPLMAHGHAVTPAEAEADSEAATPETETVAA